MFKYKIETRQQCCLSSCLVCIHRLPRYQEGTGIDWNSFRVSSEFLNSEQKHIGMLDVQPYLEGIIPKLS